MDVSAITGFLLRQLINRLEDLKRLMIMIEMRGMIPLIVGLVDSKRLPKVAVAVLSALSWFVGKFLFFCNSSTSHFQTVGYRTTWHLNCGIFKLININNSAYR